MKEHQKQKIWQILFPLMLFIFVALAVGVFIIIQTSQTNDYPSASKYANISMIFLILLSVIPGFFFLLLAFAIIYGLAKLLNITPIYAKIAQTYVFIAATKIISGANYIVKPVISIKSITAAVKKGITIVRGTVRP